MVPVTWGEAGASPGDLAARTAAILAASHQVKWTMESRRRPSLAQISVELAV